MRASFRGCGRVPIEHADSVWTQKPQCDKNVQFADTQSPATKGYSAPPLFPDAVQRAAHKGVSPLRGLCGACSADPGSFQTVSFKLRLPRAPSLERSRVCSASLRELRAALRPGKAGRRSAHYRRRSTTKASSARPPWPRQRDERIDVDRFDHVSEVDREIAERHQRRHDRLDVERGRCRDSRQSACRRACGRACRAPSRGLTGGTQNATSLTSSSSTPPLPAITTRPISGSRCRPSTSSRPPRTCRQTSMPAMRVPLQALRHGFVFGRELGAAREIERDRAGIGFVRERGRHRLEHDRIADALGGLERRRRASHQRFRRRERCHRRAAAPWIRPRRARSACGLARAAHVARSLALARASAARPTAARRARRARSPSRARATLAIARNALLASCRNETCGARSRAARGCNRSARARSA